MLEQRERVDAPLVAIAEHELQAITSYRLYVRDADIVGDRRSLTGQPRAHAAGAAALGAYPAVRQLLDTAIAPGDVQYAIFPGTADRYDFQSIHLARICDKASRAALRTSGSPSFSMAASAGSASAWPISPSASAASLRTLLMLCASAVASAGTASA